MSSDGNSHGSVGIGNAKLPLHVAVESVRPPSTEESASSGKGAGSAEPSRQGRRTGFATSTDVFALGVALQKDGPPCPATDQGKDEEGSADFGRKDDATQASVRQSRIKLERELRLAIENREFELYLQPQIALKDFSLSGAEVLLRWRHPDRGLIAPSHFLAVAESSQQICQIGQWVLATVCANYREWQEWMGPNASLAVNVSPVEMLHPRFLSNARSVLAANRVPDATIELELIETAVLANPETARDTIASLRERGIRMALDDFGVGYSSLSSLRDYAFTKIKIDRSFVQNLVVSERNQTIVKSMIDLGRRLQLAVNAEGVETPEQLQFLFENGCDEVQGFLFARPMPVSRFREWTAGFLGRRLVDGNGIGTDTAERDEDGGNVLAFSRGRATVR